MNFWRHCWQHIGSNIIASVLFYTSIPISSARILNFSGVARLAPLVGLMIGGILGLLDVGMRLPLGIPVLTASTLVVVGWMALTGGLHLDGAMDTADGLAVQDQQRRLEVMADSATGAFGAMAAIAILILKTVALSDLDSSRWLALMAACGWGRWGQQVAIARYPYLKLIGKGAFHKAAITSLGDVLPSLVLLLGLSGLQILLVRNSVVFVLVTASAGSAIAFLTGAWFNYQLGGHTVDTYGAVVEWTEALLLCVLTAL